MIFFVFMVGLFAVVYFAGYSMGRRDEARSIVRELSEGSGRDADHG